MEKRFKVIRHRNGTRTLIDRQSGMSFFRNDDKAVENGIRILREGPPTNTRKYED